jgi:hypothetical protein
MFEMPIPAGAEVRFRGIRTRAEVSRFQFYYRDSSTNNQWSTLGHWQEVPQDHGGGYVILSPIPGGAIQSKAEAWTIGIDNAMISYGDKWGGADVRVELPGGGGNQGYFHIFDGPDENTAVRIDMIF